MVVFNHIVLSPIAINLYLALVIATFNRFGFCEAQFAAQETAVRRMSLELNEIVIKMIVKYCGGDPSLVFR